MNTLNKTGRLTSENGNLYSDKLKNIKLQAAMNRKGQTIVEFSLTVLALLTLLFGIIDFAVMFYVNLTMQHAVREGARYAITGQGGEHRREDVVKEIEGASHGLYDGKSMEQPTISVVSPSETGGFSNYSGTPVDDTGKPDQIITVRLTYTWPLMTPVLKPFFGSNYTFTVKTTMRNEPWWPK